MYRYWKVQVVTVQEGTAPIPLCPICGIHVHAEILIKHQRTYLCNQAMEMRLGRRSVEIAQREGINKLS